MTDDRIAQRCPACNRQTLFLGNGGFLTCSWHTCPGPHDWIPRARAEIKATQDRIDSLLALEEREVEA